MAVRVPPVVESPSRQDHTIGEIALTVGHAPTHIPAVSVIRENTTLHAFPTDQGVQVFPSALPACMIPSIHLAGLPQLRSIDPEQPHALAPDFQCISVDHLDIVGKADRPRPKHQTGDQKQATSRLPLDVDRHPPPNRISIAPEMAAPVFKVFRPLEFLGPYTYVRNP